MQKNRMRLEVPEAFSVPPFYREQAQITFDDTSAAGLEFPFFYDILFISQPSAHTSWPWEKPKLDYYDDWTERSKGIAEAFRNRDRKRARAPMVGSLALFIDQVIWASGKPVSALSLASLIAEMEDLPYVPLNIGGRLTYIMRQPDHYLSFIQLDQLEEELKKKLAVYFSIRK